MQKFIPSIYGEDASRVTALACSNRKTSLCVTARVIAALAVMVIACACSKPPPPPEPTPQPTPVVTPVPTPKPTPTPTPPPTPTPLPTPTPVVHRYAPEGVFYVTEDFTAHIPGGLVGVPAGTQVKQLKDNGDTAQVTDGNTPFDIKKSMLTNDLDVAAAITKRSAALEAATNAARAEQEAVAAKQQQEQLQYLQTHPLAVPTPVPTPRR